jgi:hypothetical protein
MGSVEIRRYKVMKNIIVTILFLLSGASFADSTKSKVYDPIAIKKGKNNKYFSVRRNDPRIVKELMGPGDTAEVFVCFNRYLTIEFDETFIEDVHDVSKYNDLIDVSMTKSKRAVKVQLKEPVKLSKKRIKVLSGIRVELDNATRDSYNFEIIGTDCRGADDYPISAEIGKKVTNSKNSVMLHPRNFIIENTYNYERTGEYYQVNYDALAASSEEDFISLSISVNINPEHVKIKNLKKIEFKAFDSLEFNLLPIQYRVLPYVTQYETKQKGMPTWAMDFKLFVSKKYIKERGFFYLYMIDHDHKSYSKTLINLREGYKKFKKMGVEL